MFKFSYLEIWLYGDTFCLREFSWPLQLWEFLPHQQTMPCAALLWRGSCQSQKDKNPAQKRTAFIRRGLPIIAMSEPPCEVHFPLWIVRVASLTLQRPLRDSKAAGRQQGTVSVSAVRWNDWFSQNARVRWQSGCRAAAPHRRAAAPSPQLQVLSAPCGEKVRGPDPH